MPGHTFDYTFLAFINNKMFLSNKPIQIALLLAESIIADLTGDTIGAKFQFDLLFETLSNIDAIETKDQFQSLEILPQKR